MTGGGSFSVEIDVRRCGSLNSGHVVRFFGSVIVSD